MDPSQPQDQGSLLNKVGRGGWRVEGGRWKVEGGIIKGPDDGNFLCSA
jgi:hypothetical protein